MMTITVFVHAMWDRFEFPYDPMQPIGDLKRLAHARARMEENPAEFEVKVRGAPILDESRTLGEVGLEPGDSLITLRRARTAVR